MINWIIDQLFKWNALRTAIFAEVDWYNSISRTLEDPESMKTSSAMWCEYDGWRGWHIKDDGMYYFHDLPEKQFDDIFDIIFDTKESINEKIAKEIESVSLDSGEPNAQLNALGMRMLAAEIARGKK